MSDSEQAAKALLDYDPWVAEHVLRLLAHELGAGEDDDLDRLHALLINLYGSDGSDEMTTREWKADFGQIERLRALAARISELLLDASPMPR